MPESQVQPAKPSLSRRVLSFAVVRIAIGSLLVLIPVPLITKLAHRLIPKPFGRIWPEVLATIVSFLAYRFFVHRIEKRRMVEFSPAGGLAELGSGLLLGALLQLILFGALAAIGIYRFEGFDRLQTSMLGLLPFYVGVAMLEEMIGRGIIFGVTEDSLGTKPAIAISALFFGLVHLLNAGATLMGAATCTAFGVVLAASYLVTRRLWLCIGIHVAWNYVESQVFSASVSGTHDGAGLLQGHLAGSDLLTGGAFGVEGSIIALAIGVVTAALLLRRASATRPVRFFPQVAGNPTSPEPTQVS